ncbi:MAG TPA: DEAD/DEAH box helicase [Bacteroidia bacterium]|nr:DEAD/DEAH box helicase [Bacteroidia bacterium]HNT80577.1 DEAD/DEAH box helicase [Bacteroidia bacterium]
MNEAFAGLGLSSSLTQAVAELGFTKPTAIQTEAIPTILSQQSDIVALAQTGTGKTAAFGLPILQMIDPELKTPQALILCPTRELCLQICNDLNVFSKFLPKITPVPVYGGASIQNQISALKRNAQIVVSTPGRLIDLISRKAIKLNDVRYLVLDEADEMLNMGFKEDIDRILSNVPEDKFTYLFSATMPKEVERIAVNYMQNPEQISVGGRNQGAGNIDHIYYTVHSKHRYEALKRVVDFNPSFFGIIFCRTRAETREVADKLIRDGYNSDALHGDLSQQQRDIVMNKFRSRQLQMLVATDVAARGIDVDDITHVIHYNLPDEPENYTHRSGRTARAGKFGISVSIINLKEVYRIKELEKIIGKKFQQGVLPSGFEVCEKQLFSLIEKIHDVEVNEKEIEPYLPQIYSMLNDISKEELIKRFVSDEFNRFLMYYKNSADLTVDQVSKRRESNKRGNFERFFVSVGRMDGMDKGHLLRFVCNAANIESSMIGKLDINHSFSFIEIDGEISDSFLESFKKVSHRGRMVKVEPANDRKDGNRGSKSSKGKKKKGKERSGKERSGKRW